MTCLLQPALPGCPSVFIYRRTVLMDFELIRLTPDVLPLDVRRAGMALVRQAHARGTRSICIEARALIAASRKRIIRGEDLVFGSAVCLAKALQQAQEVMQASAQRHG